MEASVETRVEQTGGSIVLEKKETRAHVTATPVRDRKEGERPKIHRLCSIEWHLTGGHGGTAGTEKADRNICCCSGGRGNDGCCSGNCCIGGGWRCGCWCSCSVASRDNFGIFFEVASSHSICSLDSTTVSKARDRFTSVTRGNAAKVRDSTEGGRHVIAHKRPIIVQCMPTEPYNIQAK
ncbi:conserved domain protein [Trichinella spiralis]|uniref:hypothetical protein n=1 Tax=Trichinella spiralis TaxID=6334 RepID=UPI0001EFDE07|nr:conserved domain protein [Trichinella spiralis]